MARTRSTDPGRSDFGILLALAFAGFVDQLRAALAARGYGDLNRSFGYVARVLAVEPLSLRQLAGRLQLTSQGALKIVDDMVARGYAERIPHPGDRRSTRLRLTRRGRAALAAARAFHRRYEADLARRIGRGRVAALRSALTELVALHERSGPPIALRPL
jgi:DNA-binding MarR family transcriptional regulator